MVHLVKKSIKGNVYLYLQETARINGKSKRVWQKYLGPENKIKEQVDLRLNPEFTVTHFDFGLPVALVKIVEQLNLVEIIDRNTPKRDQGMSMGMYILFAALNRCIKPTSKNKLRRWYETTILADRFGDIEPYFNSKAYSNHFKYLTPEIIENIEIDLHKKLREEFDVKMERLFYDPTNFFTYINPREGQDLPKHGHSKENRFTLNLVGLSLFCTSDGGLPLLHRAYPGNVQDANLFREEITRFKNHLNEIQQSSSDICLVFDKGNLSDQVFKQIDEMNLNFIASIRPSTQKEFDYLTADDFSLVQLPNKKSVGILEFERKLYGKDRRLFVVYNPKRAKWQGSNLEKKLNQKLDDIKSFFKERLNVKKWRDPDAVKKKIESIIKTKQHLKLIDYKVSGKYENVKYVVSINQQKVKHHLKTLGKSYLFSNHRTMSDIDIVWLFRQQYTVEQAFKYIKSPSILTVKPVYHRNDESIRGHLFTCVVGLLIMMLLVRKVRTEFPHLSFYKITEYLSEVSLSHINFSGSEKPIKKICEMSPEAYELYNFLELDKEM